MQFYQTMIIKRVQFNKDKQNIIKLRYWSIYHKIRLYNTYSSFGIIILFLSLSLSHTHTHTHTHTDVCHCECLHICATFYTYLFISRWSACNVRTISHANKVCKANTYCTFNYLSKSTKIWQHKLYPNIRHCNGTTWPTHNPYKQQYSESEFVWIGNPFKVRKYTLKVTVKIEICLSMLWHTVKHACIQARRERREISETWRHETHK
jgi:hypothetical protein